MIDNRTANMNLPLPNAANVLSDDVARLIAAFNAIDAALGSATPFANTALTGAPTAPTAAPGTSTTQLATTAFIAAALLALVNGAPTGLDTLGELASAIGNDPAFSTTMSSALAAKAPLASPALTGTPTAPTPINSTNSTQIATTAFVKSVLADLVASAPATLDTLNELATALGNDPNFATTMTTALGAKAPLASPAFTGTPTAPTATGGTNTTQLATTAFVISALAAPTVKINTLASAAGGAGFNIPAGTAPTAPTNGDLWGTASGLFYRANGTTQQLATVAQLSGYATTAALASAFTDPAITGTITEDIYTIVDGAAFEIDPGNGSMQIITLGANRTPKGTNFANGESVTLEVITPSYGITWTDTSFGASGIIWIGGSAPTLATTGRNWIVLWKRGGQVFGAYQGSSA